MQRSPIRTLLSLVSLVAALSVVAAGCVELNQQVADTGGGGGGDTAVQDTTGGGDVAIDDTEAPDTAADDVGTSDAEVGEETTGPACPEPAACNREGVCAALPANAEETAECVDGVWVCDLSGVSDYEAEEASCDELDNDCDGDVDEMAATTAAAVLADAGCLTAGVCEAGVFARCDGGAWTCLYPAAREGIEVTCDGVDNDCDGATDEELERACATDCGPGVETCVEGAWAGCDAPEPADEVCDGADNDCDGDTDEELAAPTPEDAGCPTVGVCDGATPTVTCEPDGEGSAAWVCGFGDVADFEADEASCDDLDNDCDGETDEALEAPAGTCPSVGACAGGVAATCDGGAWECDVASVLGYEEVEVTCDGVDNDCDGETDDDLPTDGAPPCSEDTGVCEGQVLPVCVGGAWGCAVNPATADYERGTELSCDGLDNDCDGRTDEALTADEGEAVADCLAEGVCADGTFAICVAASWRCVYPDTREPVEVSCDDLDNDCDGDTDEDLTGTLADCETPPQGVCDDPAAVVTCEDGGWRCNFTSIASFEQDETMCDGLDNDCDGATDEDTAGDPLADPVAAGCRLDGVCTPETVVATCEGAAGYTCDYAGVPNYEEGDETLCDGFDNDCDDSVDENLDDDPVAAGCDLTGVCVAESVGASCGGAAGFSCDYAAVADWQETETLCDGLDNDCDGTTDQDLTDATSETDCATEGVCAAGVPALCESGGWTCRYDQVADYEAVEVSCDELDNDCDGTTDVGVCTGPGAECENDDGCDSLACRTDIDDDGMFCALDATSCVLDGGGGIDQIADGTSFCAGETANRTCAAGVWGAATACPDGTPWCLDSDGGCHLCRPGDGDCADATTPASCDASGDAFTPDDPCAAGAICAGAGACYPTAAAIPVAAADDAQTLPAIAWQDLGFQQNWVVAWTDTDADDADVLVRKVTAGSGAPFLAEQPAANGAGDQYGPSIAVDRSEDGSPGYLLVGYTDGSAADGDGAGAFLKPFSSFGPAASGPFQVNTVTAGDQTGLRLADYVNGDGVGAAVAVFASTGSAADGVHYRRYVIGTGLAIDAAEVEVAGGAGLGAPDVAALRDGRFAVVWQAPGGDAGTHDVWLRIYTAGGAPVDVATTVAAGVTGPAAGPQPRVAAVPGVGWLVAWKEVAGGTTGDIVARAYGAGGGALDDAFVVAADVGLDEGPVAVTADRATGAALVAWTDAAAPDDADGAGVAAASVDATVAPAVVGAPFLLNEAIAGDQTTPALGAGPAGAFLGAWETPDADATGVAARMLRFP